MRRMRAGRDAAPARPASSAGLPGGPGPRPTDTTVRAQGALLDGRVRPVRKRGPGSAWISLSEAPREITAMERRQACVPIARDATPQGVD